MHYADVSIIVVSYNTRDLLRTCIRSIDACGEVIVVDNASQDHSAEMVAREFPRVRLVVNQHNLGFAAAINQAIGLTTRRYFLLLNSDAVLRDGAVQRLSNFLESNPRVGLVGGQLFNPDGSFQSSYATFPGWLEELCLLVGIHPSGYPTHSESESQTAREVDWVGGALLMARRDAVGQVGGLDETYFMYAEEMDWCLRMRQQGWRVAYLPDARATHRSGGSARRKPERRRTQVYRSKWLFIRKHWGWPQARSYRILVRVVSLMKLGFWHAAVFAPDRASQVESYRYLLANF